MVGLGSRRGNGVGRFPAGYFWKLRNNFPDVKQARINCKFLVVGYGNTLRGDDGVGPRVVEAIEKLNLPDVRVLVSQQLSPEHAESVSQAQTVIFVDAEIIQGSEFSVQSSGIPNAEPKTLNSELIRWRKLEPNESSQLMAHAADPRTMLALARDVFGRAPEAWWLTIPAVKLGFSEELSAEAQRGLVEAVEKIRTLCRR